MIMYIYLTIGDHLWFLRWAPSRRSIAGTCVWLFMLEISREHVPVDETGYPSQLDHARAADAAIAVGGSELDEPFMVALPRRTKEGGTQFL